MTARLIWPGSVVVACLAFGSAGAQPHGTGSPPAIPAVPDTGLAVLVPSGDMAYAGPFHVEPDTVEFGDVVRILPAEGASDTIRTLGLVSETDWLAADVPERETFWTRWTGNTGQDVGVAFRVYRTDPFRLGVGNWVSPVIHVRGRATGTDQMAGIRRPPFPGWPWLRLVGLALLLVLVIAGVAWLWDRRHGPVVWPEREPVPPVWPQTATGLRDLLQDGSLARGEGRRFLDGLASLARRYAAGRFLVPGAEMTGQEILVACRSRGYVNDTVRTLAGLIDDADRRRYDPESPTPGWCREKAIAFFDVVQDSRVGPGLGTVPSRTVQEAEQAWAAVARELDPTGHLVAARNRGGA